MTMTKQEIEQGIQQIANYYGFDNQSDKTIEECAELVQALCKLKCGEFDEKNVIEEMADVQIMIDQLVDLMDCEEEMKKVMEHKVKRQLERIKEEKEQ